MQGEVQVHRRITRRLIAATEVVGRIHEHTVWHTGGVVGRISRQQIAHRVVAANPDSPRTSRAERPADYIPLLNRCPDPDSDSPVVSEADIGRSQSEAIQEQVPIVGASLAFVLCTVAFRGVPLGILYRRKIFIRI